jgi:acetamidase/formamidase
MPKHHRLAASPETCHWGFFDAALKPVLTVASGDFVEIDCLAAGGPDILPTTPDLELLPEQHAIHSALAARGSAHIMTGPIAVEGAVPGDVLEVQILSIECRQNWGWSRIRPLAGTLPQDFPMHKLWHIPIDRQHCTATLPWGAEIALRPFFGVMAVAPRPTYGSVNALVPREFGGNMDLKELVAGAVLFLPVWAEGALFSIGDGHAVQGDGEVCMTALETALSGSFRIVLRKDLSFTLPTVETPTHHITLGFDEDLDDAAKQALREMIKTISETTALPPEDAYMLCSLAADLRITQLVDGNKGVHAMLPRQFLPSIRSP